VSGEVHLVEEVRSIVSQIDWPCEVNTLFRNENLGCKKAVTEALKWFFDKEECGIILEDDCLPNSTFFEFCEKMLIRYRHDSRIGQISGFNPYPVTSSEAYFYSTGGSIWGWATWRRVAAGFDGFDSRCSHGLYAAIKDFTKDGYEAKYICEKLDDVNSGKMHAWAYHWGAYLKSQSLLSVIPNANLIDNIGFGSQATHTTASGPKFPAAQSFECDVIRPPEFIVPNLRRSKKQATTNFRLLNLIRRYFLHE
jgi:hypothetical protein